MLNHLDAFGKEANIYVVPQDTSDRYHNVFSKGNGNES